ncbi:MAG: NAD-binding protein [Desulfovibrio sp.]
MKMLICGAGSIARELLRQLGDEWRIVLVDKSPERLEQASALNQEVCEILAEDASSPVVLEKAGIGSMRYVLALTGDHRVNRAVADFAHDAGVPHICALVNNPEDARELREKGVHALLAGQLVAANIYHYLQDPRMRVMPLGGGPANLMEVNASEHMLVIGKRAAYFNRRKSRLVGIFRRDKLLFPRPDTVIRSGDRLVILGDTRVFQDVCTLLECDNPHFPLAYGPGLLVAVPARPGQGTAPVLMEALHLAQNLQIKNVTLLGAEPDGLSAEHLQTWPQNLGTEIRPLGEELEAGVRSACREGNFGLVLIPPLEGGMFKALGRPTYVTLARELERPLLVARGTVPYKRVLVPFSGTAMSELALEIAVDAASQLGASLAAVIVEQPDFLTGDEEGQWRDKAVARLNELRHIHKAEIEIVERRGNPVREVLAVAENFDLLVIGSTNRDRGLLTPNVGERLAGGAPCSVLLAAF